MTEQNENAGRECPLSPPIQIVNCESIQEDELTKLNLFTGDFVCIFSDVWRRAPSRVKRGRVPPSEVLYSLLNWERKVGLIALEVAGADLARLKMDVDQLRQIRPRSDAPVLDFADVQRLMVAARNESHSRADHYVGTEHLVLALSCSEDEAMQVLFREHGISHRSLTEAIDELLRPDNG